ncbi:hypothetical protein XcvCFBP7113P_12570 [Xanthomonas citri pv. vignicola]|nr:hypothetical protein XcvCFBP7113P_12570 [Xanthomonas citri pv. vignicola]
MVAPSNLVITLRPIAHSSRSCFAARLNSIVSRYKPSQRESGKGSTPFSRTLTRRPIKAMRSVHVKAQEVHCRVQAWRG